MIVNNVAGFGGAVALQDTAKVRIINNTIADNDSTATGANAFGGNPSVSTPQGAGILSNLHSAGLQAAIGTGAGPEFADFANPVLYNNILWHNRSFYWDTTQTTSPMGGLVPNATIPYWDLQVFGATSATQKLDPNYCILSDIAGYTGPPDKHNSASDPMLIAPYFNQLLAVAAPGEGGNFIQVVYKPLTRSGDYHIKSGSPAINAGLNLTDPILSPFTTLQKDYDGQTRPNTNGDIGADEFSALTLFTITSSAGANGNISPLGAVSVVTGSNQTFVITPNTGFKVLDVLVDGGSVGALTLYTFDNVQASHTISASFAVSNFTIAATATTVGGGAGGTISPSGTVVVGSGGNQLFNIASNPGYHLTDVLVEGGSIGPVPSYTFTNVVLNHTIEAIFASNADAFTIVATAETGGTITPPGATAYNFGATQAFTITPDAGFRIVDVLVDGVSLGPVTSYTFTNLQASHTISARFVVIITSWVSLSGATPSAPALAWNPSANKLQMVVRVADNSLWVSSFSSTGAFNNDWTPISGMTPSTPALAWNPSANKLQMVVRVADNSLWVSSFSSTGAFNNDWTPISGMTPSTPALAWNPSANKLQMVVRVADNSLWVSSFSSTGAFNNDWTPISGMTPSTPALAWNPSANKLQMVVRVADNSLWVSSFSSTGAFNNDWTPISGMTPSTPALAWNPSATKLQMVVRVADNSLWVSSFNSTGAFNNDWTPISGMTPSTPALAWNPVANILQGVVRAADNSIWTTIF